MELIYEKLKVSAKSTHLLSDSFTRLSAVYFSRQSPFTNRLLACWIPFAAQISKHLSGQSLSHCSNNRKKNRDHLQRHTRKTSYTDLQQISLSTTPPSGLVSRSQVPLPGPVGFCCQLPPSIPVYYYMHFFYNTIWHPNSRSQWDFLNVDQWSGLESQFDGIANRR